MKDCICIKPILDYQTNHRYKYTLDDSGKIMDGYYVYTNNIPSLRMKYRGYFFEESKFNTYFIDVSKHRQKILTQILC